MTSGFSYVGGPVAWRFPLDFQFIFIFTLYSTAPWLPESPRRSIAKGRIDEAEKILADLEFMDIEDSYIITQPKDIQWLYITSVRTRLDGIFADEQELRKHMHDSSPGSWNGHASNAAASGNKCDILLPPYCVHPLCRPQQRNGAPPRRLQFSFLPALLTHRHPKRGAVGRGKMMMYAARPMLLRPDHHHHDPL